MAEKSLVIVALPKASDPVHTIGSEEKHATLLYLGSDVDRVAFELVKASVLACIKSIRFTESVSRVTTLGEDGARVWMIDSDNGLRRWRERLLGMPAIRALYDSIEQYPTYTPHVTIGYPAQGQDKLDGIVESLALTVDKIKFDRIAVWYGDDHDSIYRLYDEDELFDAVEASHADLDNFLAHYGVKGMKWGVSRDGSGSSSGSSSSKTAVTPEEARGSATGAAVRTTLGYATGLRNSPKYKGKNLRDDAELRKEYDADVSAHFKRSMKHELKIFAIRGALIGGVVGLAAVFPPAFALLPIASSKSASRVLAGSPSNPSTFYVDEEMSHAARTAYQVAVTEDSSGFITDMKVEKVEMAHSMDPVDNFLAHYGVKGMKWGVRRSDAQLGRARRGGKKGPNSDGDNDSATSRSDAKKAAAAKDTFISADAERFIKTRQKKSHEMSDREIREALNRAKMVKEYDEMFSDSPNSQLKQKVESLRLQKEYAKLNAEMNPSRVKKLISTASAGYNAYSKLDKATDGALSEQLSKSLGLKSGYQPKHAAASGKKKK